MFRGLLNSAKSAVSAVILKYVARASVAVPFIIALGFALAAGTVMLTDRYGQQAAYWIMAAGLAMVGLLATLFVSVKEHEEAVADTEAAREDTEEVATQAMAQAPFALIGALLSLPGGPSTTLKVARLLGKNYALVLLLVLIGALFWPKTHIQAADPASPDKISPDSLLHPTPNGLAQQDTRSRTGRSLSEAMTILLTVALGTVLALTFVAPDAKQAVAVAMGF